MYTLGIQFPTTRGTCKPDCVLQTHCYYHVLPPGLLCGPVSTLGYKHPCLSDPLTGCLLCRPSQAGAKDELAEGGDQDPETMGQERL